MAEAINQNNVAEICKSFATSMKSVKDLKLDTIKTSMATFSNSAEYIIKFYNISSTIIDTIKKSSSTLDADSIKAQTAVTDTIGKVVGTINTFIGMKLPNMIQAELKFLQLRWHVNRLMDIFVGRGGVCDQLRVVSYLGGKHTIDKYDKRGNLIKTDTVEGMDFKKTFETFKEMVDSILEMIESTEKIFKVAIKAEVLRWVAMDALLGDPTQKRDGLFDLYIKLIQSNAFKQLSYAKTGEYIQKTSDNITAFAGLVDTIVNTAGIKNFISLQFYRKFMLPEIGETLSRLSTLLIDDKGNVITFDDSTTENLNKALLYVTTINSMVVNIAELSKAKINSKKVNKVISNVKLVITEIADFSEDVKSRKFAGIKPQIATIKSIIDSMLGLVKDIILLALAFIPMALATPLALGTLWVIGAFIKVATKVINWMVDKKDYEQTAIAVANIAKIVGLMLLMVVMVLGTLVLISLALPLLIESAGQTLAAFAVIALITFGIAWLAVIINKILQKMDAMWEGLLMMIALIGVMMLVAGTLMLFALMSQWFFEDNHWLYALAMFGVVGAVTLAIAGLGYLIAVLLPGIASFAAGVVLVTIAIGAMLLIGLELNGLAEFDFDEAKRDKIKVATASIIGAAKAVVDGLFNGFNEDDTPKQSNNGPFVRFFKSIFKGAAFVIEALAASAVMIFTTISVTMMLLIGLELQSLANYQIDRDAVLGNVNTIMGTANSVIDAIFQPAEEQNTPGGSGFLGALKHFFTGLVDIIELIASIGKLALTMVAIALVRLVGGELNWIANFDTTNTDKAAQNTQTIMSTADAVVHAIFSGGEEETKEGPGRKFLGFIKNAFQSIATVIESIVGVGKMGLTLAAVGMVALLARELQTINDISNTVDKKQILDNTDLILTVSDQIVKKVFDATTGFDIDEKKLKKFNKLTSALDDFIKAADRKADNLGQNIDNTIKFVDKIDSVKLENLETATNMFEKMAEFSKSISGNFEGLADAINDKIMPLLEELNGSLDKTNKSIESGTFSQPTVVSTTTAGGAAGTAAGGAAAAGRPVPPPKDYSRILGEIKQEIVKVQKTLTDGSQRTTISN